ncbi:MAG TPA: hypothetical protein VH207_01935 [Chthoniobacterales bacterium]|jgi:hypothetical protein|nr:hypothetical protein [Chthoniobacterales bacterium]
MLRELHRPELTPAQVRPMTGDGSRALVERALAAAEMRRSSHNE